MTEYASVKTSKLKNVLKWLKNIGGVEITSRGRHAKIRCNHNGNTFPLPISHKNVNRFIIKKFAEWLVENEICGKEEFDSRL